MKQGVQSVCPDILLASLVMVRVKFQVRVKYQGGLKWQIRIEIRVKSQGVVKPRAGKMHRNTVDMIIHFRLLGYWERQSTHRFPILGRYLCFWVYHKGRDVTAIWNNVKVSGEESFNLLLFHRPIEKPNLGARKHQFVQFCLYVPS